MPARGVTPLTGELRRTLAAHAMPRRTGVPVEEILAQAATAGMSRRTFLRGAGVAGLTAVGLAAGPGLRAASAAAPPTIDTDACMTWCEAASCVDGLRNGDEAYMDCGGACAGMCRSGQGCDTAADCFSGACDHDRCTTHRLTAGSHHTCVLLEGGDVRCWGLNESGQLGYENTDWIGDDEVPSSVGVVPVGGRVVQLAAGDAHTFALLDDGAVRCWGAGSAGLVNLDGPAVQLAAGYGQTCALLEGRSVQCWGYASLRSIDVGGRVAQIVAGWYHTCAILEGGAVRCWGSNGDGQLGYGHEESIPESAT